MATRPSIGQGTSPLICTPLVGPSAEAIHTELAAVLPKAPDVIEWRADFFGAIGDTRAVVAMARKIRDEAPGCALIFTIRSRREGGQPIALSDNEAVKRAAAICEETDFEYIDCELGNALADIEYLRDIAHGHDRRVIASYHNFKETPARDFLLGKFLEAEKLGLDVAKVAVMPKGMDDVLTLLGVTLEGKGLVKIPLITMSMGGYGAISRMVGGVFGSSLSFAVGRSASAPGQIPIEDLRSALAIVERSKGGL